MFIFVCPSTSTAHLSVLICNNCFVWKFFLKHTIIFVSFATQIYFKHSLSDQIFSNHFHIVQGLFTREVTIFLDFLEIGDANFKSAL